MSEGWQETEQGEIKTQPSRQLLDALTDALEKGANEDVRALCKDLRTPELAEVIELLPHPDRLKLIEALRPDFDYDIFSQLDETVRDQLSEDLPKEFLAKAAAELDTDDAAYLLENLEESQRQEVLEKLSSTDRAALERNFDYDEETAGRIMQSDYVTVPPFWNVGQAIDYMREARHLPDVFSELFVVDPAYRVLGSVELSKLVRTKRNVAIKDIMRPERHIVRATMDQEDVARKFQNYDLMSAPVVDENERLVGVITVDDVVDVIHDEAEEDMKALAGVGDETMADSVYWTARSRVPWLIVNLGTAILASLVIQMFDATIEQMVSLAVLMPIVASMGGNAGTQTMTVTVRALATNKLGRVNAPRVILREAIVGLLNGLMLSIIMAAVVFFWFGSTKLGGVVAAAMIVNLFAAGLAGILIPLTMDNFDLDPAPASGVIVTAITDVIGFFAFLGLAALWLL